MLAAAGDGIKALYVMGANAASEKSAWAHNLERTWTFWWCRNCFSGRRKGRRGAPAVQLGRAGQHLHQRGASGAACAQGVRRARRARPRPIG
ncbi:MAG: hypothetical protein R3A10_19625 [Caldilineaceae bacterium]